MDKSWRLEILPFCYFKYDKILHSNAIKQCVVILWVTLYKIEVYKNTLFLLDSEVEYKEFKFLYNLFLVSWVTVVMGSSSFVWIVGRTKDSGKRLFYLVVWKFFTI